MQGIQDVISGGDSTQQLQAEVGCLSRTQRHQLCGITLDVLAEQGLALPWNQL